MNGRSCRVNDNKDRFNGLQTNAILSSSPNCNFAEAVRSSAARSSLRSDYWLILFAWLLYVAAETLLFPVFAPAEWGVPLNAQGLFSPSYYALVALFIAFPLSNRLLTRQSYTGFAVSALLVLAASSLVLECVLEPLLFGSKIIFAATYLSFIEGATITLLFTALRLMANRRRNERRIIELQRANAEAELQYLKGQINPHVLFNALNNIYSHALHKSDNTPDLILKLADMLRYMIYDCDGDRVPLEKEVRFLSDYVDIQKLALDERGSVGYRFHGCAKGKHIAPFLLIPFVENCFKHSLDTMERSMLINIDLTASEGRLHLACSNSFDDAALRPPAKQDSGIGLANARRRLELLFGSDFELSAYPRDGVFHVSLDVPVQQ